MNFISVFNHFKLTIKRNRYFLIIKIKNLNYKTMGNNFEVRHEGELAEDGREWLEILLFIQRKATL